MGVARDLARRAERQPARRHGRARACSRRSSCAPTGDSVDRRRPRSTGRRDGDTDSRRRETEAADAIGGVKQQRSVFNQIIGVTLAIAVVVVALFFALLTVERVGLYGVLKAIGARSRTLFAGVVAQAAVVALIAAAIGAGVRGRARRRRCRRAPSRTSSCPAGSSSAPWRSCSQRSSGSAFSLRRVLRVDPASAIGRAS